jgi:ubiquinone/menaquinone biosynthesis C-methylase UbiE
MTDKYMLGHSLAESRRLVLQAELLEPITRRFLIEAGIQPGMRVLDVGTGMGDVAFLVADMVGAEGEVIGADTSAAAIVAAAARGKGLSRSNVRFVTGDPATLSLEPAFDAVVGRYVLLFQKEPGSMLRALNSKLRPGGLIAFHELDWQSVHSSPPAPTFDQCCRWAIEALRLGGADPFVGSKLYAAFVQAGFPPPALRVESIAGGASDPTGAVRKLFDTIFPEAFVHTLDRCGVAKAADIGAETLPDRLHAEVAGLGGIVVGKEEIGIWARRA